MPLSSLCIFHIYYMQKAHSSRSLAVTEVKGVDRGGSTRVSELYADRNGKKM